MKATVYVNPDDEVTHKPKAVPPQRAMAGTSFPYVTKRAGFPLFVLEGEPALTDCQGIDAPPGMVGMNFKEELFSIDADGEAQRLPVRLLTDREYERYLRLKESFTREAA